MNHIVYLPVDLSLVEIEPGTFHISSAIRLFLSEEIKGAWRHDYFGGQSRFSFEDDADALTFADAYDAILVEIGAEGEDA